MFPGAIRFRSMVESAFDFVKMLHYTVMMRPSVGVTAKGVICCSASTVSSIAFSAINGKAGHTNISLRLMKKIKIKYII